MKTYKQRNIWPKEHEGQQNRQQMQGDLQTQHKMATLTESASA